MNIHDIVTAYRGAKSRLLLLDYDGVLAPIVPLPENAVPTKEVVALLTQLCQQADCVIVSGRYHITLQEWLGNLPLAFAAEHGLWRKDFADDWQPTATTEASWKNDMNAIMQRYVDTLPGSFIEEKVVSLVFHYRNVEAADVDAAASQLIAELEPLLAASSLRILHGKKVVEVLPSAINKGAAAMFWVNKKSYDFILAAGDDVTDEALFAAMPKSAVTVKVGAGETAAKYRAASQPDFVQLLAQLAETV